jgi:hypothetical protein
MKAHRVAFPIYLLASSIVLVIVMSGYVIYQDRQHAKALASLSLARQQGVNETLRGMCDRFELRDEIFLRILEDAATRQRKLGDVDAAEALELNILALRLAQGDCLQDIPKVVKPPPAP